ncbi:hypothetical protein L3Q82_024501, partial [Scortum barcoo]
VDMLWLRMTPSLLSFFLLFPFMSSVMAAAEPAGCKIRITDKGLQMLKFETQKFVEEELSNISMPEMKGKDGRFQYTITDVKITELNLTHAELQFIPDIGLLFDVQNSSISLSFHRRILYWFFDEDDDDDCTVPLSDDDDDDIDRSIPHSDEDDDDDHSVPHSDEDDDDDCCISLSDEDYDDDDDDCCTSLSDEEDDDDDCTSLSDEDDDDDDDDLMNMMMMIVAFPSSLSYDTGNINASAEGVNINTALTLIRDDEGRLKINNITCDAKIAKMRAEFSGTLGRVYHFLSSFLTTGMRFLLNQQICPALNHAALVHVNSMLETIPVKTEVDQYIGIDYSLIDDPVVTSGSLDMNFRGMFFDLSHPNDTLVNYAIDPVIREYDRMVYLALSEFFFDSGMFSYYRAGIFQMHIVNEKMSKDLEMLLRTTYFGAIMMLNPALVDAPISLQIAVNSPPKTSIKTSGATVVMTAIVKVMLLPPGQPPVQLSSMTMETKFNAKVSMKGKRLAVHADLRRFKIFSNQSALESLALIPLQAPLKTMLQMSVVPLINNWTKRGVQIPLADGMDFIEEVVEYHN